MPLGCNPTEANRFSCFSASFTAVWLVFRSVPTTTGKHARIFHAAYNLFPISVKFRELNMGMNVNKFYVHKI